MAKTESEKRSSVKYNKEKTALITIRLVYTTDADILAQLDAVGNKQGYIKSLIRADIARANSERPAQNLSPVTFNGDDLTAPVFFNASARNDDDPGVPSGGNPWYAVQRNPEDDWDYDGSFDLEEAKAKARKLREEYPNALIAVIDNSLEIPFCTEEIRDF